MAKVLLLLALCVLPAIVSASRPTRNPFAVTGSVVCESCRCGFENEMSKPIAGAKVKVVCTDRKTGNLVYEKFGKTNSEGKYRILVDEDHDDQICESVLVESSQADCAEMSPGRERSRVILTNFNGMASTTRFANTMLFQTSVERDGCKEVLAKYQLTDEDV